MLAWQGVPCLSALTMHAPLSGITSPVVETANNGVVVHNHVQAQWAPQKACAPTIAESALQLAVARLQGKTC